MGFNRKSDAGPYEGMPGQQRYQSDVIFGYFPLLIPALDFKYFGCNAIYHEPSFKIHEAYGVNTTINKGIVQPAETIAIDNDTLYVSGTTEVTALTHDESFVSNNTALYYGMLTFSGYNYGSNSFNTSIKKFQFPNYSGLFNPSTIYVPNVPVLLPMKVLREVADPDNEKMATAIHQLQIPVLYNQDVTINTDLVDTETAIGDVKYLTAPFYVNNETSIRGVIGINNSYVRGADAIAIDTSATWSDKAGSQAGHMKGISIKYSSADADPVMLVIHSQLGYANGLIVGIVPPGTNTNWLETTINKADLGSGSSFYSTIYITDFAQLIAGLEALPAALSELNTYAHFVNAFIRYLYYIYSATPTFTHAVQCSSSVALSSPVGYDTTRWIQDAGNGFQWYVENVLGNVWNFSTGVQNQFKYVSGPSLSLIIKNIGAYAGIGFKSLSYLADLKAVGNDYVYPLSYKAKCERTYNGADGYVVTAIDIDVTNTATQHPILALQNHGNASFHEITVSSEYDLNDGLLTNLTLFQIGFYQRESSLATSGTPGWIEYAIAFEPEDVSIEASDYKEAYALSLTDIQDTNEIHDDMLYPTKIMTTFRAGYALNEVDGSTILPSLLYSVNNLVSGISDDFTATINYKSETSISLLQHNTEPENSKVFYIDNLSADEEYLTILNPKVNSIISITSKYDLTCVKYNSTYYYFGILDVETLDHYSPKNIFNRQSLDDAPIFTSIPIITEIKLIRTSEENIEMLVTYTYEDVESVMYVTLAKVKNTGYGKLYKDTVYRECYILQQYLIDPQNNELKINDAPTDNYNESYGQLLFDRYNAGTKRTVSFMTYDKNLAYLSSARHNIKMNISTVTSYYDYNYLPQAAAIIRDTADFVSNAMVLPMLHPIEGLLPVNDDIGYLGPTYPPISFTTTYFIIKQILYFSTRLLNYYTDADHSIGGAARLLKTGSIILCTLPSIDKAIKSYAVLPEKVETLFSVDSSENLKMIGLNTFSANDRSYTAMQDNLYEASRLNLIPRNTHGLFNLNGDIYNTGNYFFVTDGRQTHIYMIQENSIPMFLKTIDGVIVCDPVNIGKEIIVVCKNGIFSLNSGNLYNFEFPITNAILKPVTGNGYLLYAYANDRTSAVNLTAMDGTELVCVNLEYLIVDALANNYGVFHINEDSHIIKLDYVIGTLDPAEMVVIKNNCYGSTINIYTTQENVSTDTYVPLAYTMLDSGTYHIDPYIISEPVQLRNEKAQAAIVDTAFIYAKGYGDIQFLLYDGKNTIVDKTITVGTSDEDEYTEIKIELGMIEYDNLYYKLVLSPTTDNYLKVQMVKLRLNYLQEI